MEIKKPDNLINLIRTTMYSVTIGIIGNVFMAVILLIYPVLFMESSIKNGIIPTMISMFVSSGIIALMVTPLAGLSLFFILAPMVLIFHYCVINQKRFYITFLLMFLVLLISFTSYNFGIANTNPVDVQGLIDTLVEFQIENLEGSFSSLELSNYEDSLRTVYDYSIRLIPAIVGIGVAVFVYINYLLTGRRLLRQGILIHQPPAFGNLQLPRFSIILFGIAIGIILLMRYLEIDYYSNVYLNAILVFGFLYFVNGLALFSNFLQRFRVPNIGRMFVYLSAVFFPAFGGATAVIGLIDALINFRRIRIKKE